MSEEMHERSSSDSESESEINSIDLLMESYVNLLELFKELEKDSKKNLEMLEKLLLSWSVNGKKSKKFQNLIKNFGGERNVGEK